MFFKEWRHEKRKRKLKKEALEANEMVAYLDVEVEELNSHWNSFLLYLSSENLVKQSSRLVWLTWMLFLTALAMIALAMQQSNLWPFSLWS